MKNSSQEIAAAVKAQRRLVAYYAPESVQVYERAVGLLPTLRSQLGLGPFLGSLSIDPKPRLLYRFRLAQGSPVAQLGPQVVLKIYGDRPRGEGPLQQLWRARGLDVPHLECGEVGGCSWLVMEYLDLRSVLDTPSNSWELVDHLACMAKTMHRPAPSLEPLLRPLEEVMVPRWEEAVTALRRSGHDVPSTWLGRAVGGYMSGPAVPLHGDLAPGNVGRVRGRVTVFDASALFGVSSFDAARWSARMGPEGAGPEALLRRWVAVEGLSLSRTVWDLLAAECVLEAGSREIVRLRAIRRDPHTPRAVTAAGVPDLLAVASQQWA